MKYLLVQTCGACPEQYDVFRGTEQVGYLRLRHGIFRAHLYGPEGDEVLYVNPHGDGCFDPEERDYYLRLALAAIQATLGPDKIEYEVNYG